MNFKDIITPPLLVTLRSWLDQRLLARLATIKKIWTSIRSLRSQQDQIRETPPSPWIDQTSQALRAGLRIRVRQLSVLVLTFAGLLYSGFLLYTIIAFTWLWQVSVYLLGFMVLFAAAIDSIPKIQQFLLPML